MAIKRYKPTTPGRRGMTVTDYSGLSKVAPEKSLLEPVKKHSGRNNTGRITVRHQGGGNRRKYRVIDFKREKLDMPATVLTLEYDPNRSAHIALVQYEDGEQLNKAKEILAYELTKMVHGEAEAEKAQATARGLFSGAADHEHMPSTALDAALVKDGAVGLLAAMVATGLCGSNREARQLVQQGGVLVDGEKITDPKAVLTVDALSKGVVIKKGKKVYHKVTL